MIDLKEAHRLMTLRDARNWPVPFKISFFTADLKRDKGGELRTIEKAILAKNSHASTHVATAAAPDKLQDSKSFISGTRNLYCTETQNITKCHLWLIHSINSQEVAL